MAIATVDALGPIVAGVRAFFTARNIVADVDAGEWNVERNNGPAYVVISPGAFTYSGSAATAPGTRMAPSHWWDLGGGIVAPVVGQRLQTFDVWVHGVPPGDFTSQDPTQVAQASMVATIALSDLAYAALRDIHGHDLPPVAGKPLDPERGEFAYGACVTWGFQIPIPVLGDTYTYAAAQQMVGTILTIVNGVASTPGDTVGAP